MPIRIILDWEVSIRPCEFKNFSKIINNQTKPIGKAEERELVKYLTESGRSLAEIVVYSDENIMKSAIELFQIERGIIF